VSNAIQLTLNPERGFGLLMWGELLVDSRTGLPFFAPTKRAAKRAFRHATPDYLKPQTAIVEVEIHEPNIDEAPTYLIGKEVR
jgi:hypothetical protein